MPRRTRFTATSKNNGNKKHAVMFFSLAHSFTRALITSLIPPLRAIFNCTQQFGLARGEGADFPLL